MKSKGKKKKNTNSPMVRPEERRNSETSSNATMEKKLTKSEPTNSDTLQDVEIDITTEIKNAVLSKDKRKKSISFNSTSEEEEIASVSNTKDSAPSKKAKVNAENSETQMNVFSEELEPMDHHDLAPNMPPETDNSPDFDNFKQMKFVLKPNTDFPTAYSALVALEQEKKDLAVATKVTQRSTFLLTPKTVDTAKFLFSVKLLSTNKLVDLERLIPEEEIKKTILVGFPMEFPVDILLDIPNITSAKRLVSRLTKLETRQILLSVKGEIPNTFEIRNLGSFKTRTYIPEPLRCFKCQRFGHHKEQCRAPARCAICSKLHDTSQCLEKYKKGENVQAKCPNCQSHHHAWSLKCPERHIRLQKPNKPDFVPSSIPPKSQSIYNGNPDQNRTPVASKNFTKKITNSNRLYSKVVTNSSTETIHPIQERPSDSQSTPSVAPPSETYSKNIDTLTSSLERIMEQANQMINRLVQLISNFNSIMTNLPNIIKTQVPSLDLNPSSPEASFSLSEVDVVEFTEEPLEQLKRKHPNLEIFAYSSQNESLAGTSPPRIEIPSPTNNRTKNNNKNDYGY